MSPTTSPTDRVALPVVVIGGGPVGLAAAAHLSDRGLPFVVLEQGPTVGAAVRQWGHVRTFTPWRYVVDPTAERLLVAGGWTPPTTDVPPTGADLVELYLEPLAALMGGAVRVGHRVLAVSRAGVDRSRSRDRGHRPFLVRFRDADGEVGELLARAVVDASGTWGHPNPLGASGLPALGEDAAGDLLVGPLPDVLGRDRTRFAGRTTLVVGSGHSAATTLLDLARLAHVEPGTRIRWAVRGADPTRLYGAGDADGLPARGRLGADLRHAVASGAVELVTGYAVTALVPAGDTVTVVGVTAAGTVHLTGVHTVVAATGFRPDLSLLAELRLDLDPGLESTRTLGPLIDPAFHSCGTVPPHGHRELAHPDPDLYVVGAKSYGRAPTFLIATGNEQVRSVVAALAGDTAAADEVHLVLPATGVCTVGTAAPDARSGTGPGAAPVAACCGDVVTTGAPGGPAATAAGRRLLPADASA